MLELISQSWFGFWHDFPVIDMTSVQNNPVFLTLDARRFSLSSEYFCLLFFMKILNVFLHSTHPSLVFFFFFFFTFSPFESPPLLTCFPSCNFTVAIEPLAASWLSINFAFHARCSRKKSIVETVHSIILETVHSIILETVHNIIDSRASTRALLPQ